MDAYVPKPLDAAVLFEAMEGVLGGAAIIAETSGAATLEARQPPAPPLEPLLPPAGAEMPAIDRTSALQKLGGDEELLLEIIGLYLDDCPKVMERLSAALAEGDAEGVWKAAHRLKGSVGSLAAQPALEAARDLETVGRAGDLEEAAAAFERLEHELERLAAALTALRAEVSG